MGAWISWCSLAARNLNFAAARPREKCVKLRNTRHQINQLSLWATSVGGPADAGLTAAKARV
jgi:hypothetical protein